MRGIIVASYNIHENTVIMQACKKSLANNVQFCTGLEQQEVQACFLSYTEVESLKGGERRLWSWGTAVVRQLGQVEEDEALAVRHLWGNLGILLQRRNAALLASMSPSSMSKSLRAD